MTTTQDLAIRDGASIMERAVIQGDLSDLTPEERVDYYRRTCDSLQLNPYTKPFEYLELDAPGGGKKLVLYARKDCTDQLRDIKKVSITRLEKEWTQELYVVTAYALLPGGRTDSAVGAVPISKEGGYWEDVTGRDGKPVTDSKTGKPRRRFTSDGTFVRLTGDALANAIMKAETKAKRRVTLSICGLGMTDESEIDSIPGALRVGSDFGYVPTREADVGDTTRAPATAVVELVTSADSRLWKRWLEVLAEAQGLGVRISARRLPIALDELKAAANEALNGIAAAKNRLAQMEANLAAAKIDQAAAADTAAASSAPPSAEQPTRSADADSPPGPAERGPRSYGQVFGDEQLEPPTEAEKAAPRDLETGEVLDSPLVPATPKIAVWAENRELSARAQELGLQGIPVLNNRSALDVVAEANRVLRERIRNHELDQKLTREQEGHF